MTLRIERSKQLTVTGNVAQNRTVSATAIFCQQSLSISASKSANERPACVKDTITKPLIDILEHDVLLMKNLAIPLQALRADRQADGRRKIVVKDGGKICFVRLEPGQGATHALASNGESDLVRNNGSRCGHNLLCGGVASTRVRHFVCIITVEIRR
jgi:hypothetical protein